MVALLIAHQTFELSKDFICFFLFYTVSFSQAPTIH